MERGLEADGAHRVNAADTDTVLTGPDDNPAARGILNAAVATISARGYHGTSVRDIAAAAGVSPGTLYNYFGCKQQLLVTLLCRAMDLLIRQSEQALETSPPDPLARLDALVDAHVRVHAMSARESLIGNSELRSLEGGYRDRVIARRDTQQRLFDAVITEGVQAGVLVVDDVPVASRYLVTACTAVAAWYRPGGGLGVDELVRRYQALSRQLLGCRLEGKAS